MFGSVQIKQEYGVVDEKNHQNMVGEQGNIDYSVFNNQNIQYAYHQLPHFWDQALQVQSNQYPKDFSQKNEDNNSSRQDTSRVNQSISFLSTNYLNNHLQQQQQQHQLQQQPHNSFASNPPSNEDQSSNMSQANQSNMESNNIDSTIESTIINSSTLMNSTLVGIQSNSSIIKQNTLGRPKSLNSSSSSPGKKIKCQCEICFKEFGHKSNLFIHMRTHNGERPYKCKECDKTFTHSGNLAIHMRVHSGERPYTCQVCGKTFSHSGNLSTHLRTHSGVKPYKCSICAKEFRHSGNLSIHERIHSGVKPFQCKVCGKEFYHSGNLSTHRKKHPVTVANELCNNTNVLPPLTPINPDYHSQVKEAEITIMTSSNDQEGEIIASNEVVVETSNEESNSS